MKATRWRLEIAAIVIVIATFAAVHLYRVTVDPPENAKVARELAIFMAVPASLWAAAAWLVVRRWWDAVGARLSTMDTPGRVLATAAAAMPEHRREWGAAMLAELPEVDGGWRRWRFALSCVRMALWSPPAGGWPVTALVTAVVVAAVAAAGPLTRAAVPGLGVFATTFAALAGLLVILRVARSRRRRPRVSLPIILMVCVVSACIATTAIFLVRHPDAAQNLPPGAAVFVAGVLAGSLWLAVAPPRSLATDRLGPHVGILAALAFAAVSIVSARGPGIVLGLALIWMGAPLFGIVGLVVGAARRSFRVGLHAVAWSILASALSLYAIWLPEALRLYARDRVMLLDGDGGIPVGVNLSDATFWAFVLLPLLGIPCGVLGAGSGAWFGRGVTESAR